MTDVSIKRKIRNYISAARPADSESDDGNADNARYKIYVESGVALNGRHRRAYTALNLPAKKTDRSQQMEAQRWMCDNFFDVRMFGAVMSTGDHNCGQLKGPIQIGFASSIDPINPLDQSITRMAVTKESDLSKERTMGRKAIVPYGLYRAHIYYSPHFGVQTGVTEEDLELFWKSLQMMWDLDNSSARTGMACRGLYVFSHDNPLGDAPAHKLLDQVEVEKNPAVEYPSRFTDYKVTAPASGVVMPGVTCSGDLS
jgi:CRISPR-associated protein Csd2